MIKYGEWIETTPGEGYHNDIIIVETMAQQTARLKKRQEAAEKKLKEWRDFCEKARQESGCPF